MTPTQRTLDRLNHILAMEAGWLDGGGKPLCDHLRQHIQRYAAMLEVTISPALLYIYATEDGGISLEWTTHISHSLTYEADEGVWVYANATISAETSVFIYALKVVKAMQTKEA